MSGDQEERFANLLREGIRAVTSKKGMKISALELSLTEQLGRTRGNPIEYWKQGHLPKNPSEFNILTRILAADGGLSKKWLIDIWNCTNFSGLPEAISDLFPASSHPYIDPGARLNLMGRQKQVSDILKSLISREQKIVGIDGMGGIGKTAITQAIALRILEDQLFEAVFWITDEISDDNAAFQFTTAFIFNAIANSLGIKDFEKLPQTKKRERLKGAFSQNKYLVVLDNLERLEGYQDAIVEQLSEILGFHSKAILLSRKRFHQGVFHVHLSGLSSDFSVRLLRREAKSRAIHGVTEAETKPLNEIAEKCGGSPLALKLVVGQLGYQSLPVVLERLQNIVLTDSSFSDEYSRFYRNIFLPSWALLAPEGKRLLICMSHFSSGHGGTSEAVHATSGLSARDTTEQIDKLWSLAFLETMHSGLDEVRYYLHALTRYFVLSDIVKTIEKKV